MSSVKTQIVNQIIYYIQDFQDVNTDMLHTVIQGPPGVGKTMLGEIISEIYFTLDIIQQPTDEQTYTKQTDCCEKSPINNTLDVKLKKVKIINAKRSDLIGKYLGQTAIKTQEFINRSLGGVLFIDEAYSLGNAEQRDSFSKECIDTINQNLTEKKNQLLVIIAGYKHSLDTCFFAYNDGLKRRFPFVYTIDTYSPFEMGQIFKKMISEIDQIKKWSVSEVVTDKELEKFFKTNSKYFSNSAGDIETFVFNIKIEHAKRVFPCPFKSKVRRQITKDDLYASFIVYKSNKIIPEDDSKLFSHIYI
jgi:SpoVK/Ycf46/Vps4 family AAA+-type ATPase